MSSVASSQTYRLKLGEDGRGLPRDIEFTAGGADAALQLAHRLCEGRVAELFENGRKLADVKYVRTGGFWLIG